MINVECIFFQSFVYRVLTVSWLAIFFLKSNINNQSKLKIKKMDEEWESNDNESVAPPYNSTYNIITNHMITDIVSSYILLLIYIILHNIKMINLIIILMKKNKINNNTTSVVMTTNDDVCKMIMMMKTFFPHHHMMYIMLMMWWEQFLVWSVFLFSYFCIYDDYTVSMFLL